MRDTYMLNQGFSLAFFLGVNSYNAIGVVTKATAGTMAFSTFRAVGYLVVFARALI